jgi:hypothetical protein
VELRTIFDSDNARHFYDQIAWFKSLSSAQPLAGVMSSLSYTGRAGPDRSISCPSPSQG